MNQALATIDADSIIERIAAGEYQSHIARSLKVPKQRLHEVISKHPSYRQALKLRNMEKLDSAQEAIENPENDSAIGADLARATQAFKAAAWRAERECPEEWGNKQQVEISGKLQLDAVLVSMDLTDNESHRTIENED